MIVTEYSSDVEEGEILEPRSNDRTPNQLPGTADGQMPSTSMASVATLSTTKRKKLKKALRQAAANGNTAAAAAAIAVANPLPYYNIYGDNPRASIQVVADQTIRLPDVQNLVLWVLGESLCPRWAFIKNKPLVEQVVLLMAHGLTSHLYHGSPELFPRLQQLSGPATVIALNSHTRPSQSAAALMNVPLTKKRKRQVEVEQKEAKKANHGQPPLPAEQYVASVADLQTCSYPLPKIGADGQMECPPGFVATKPAAGEPPRGKYGARMVALDCEMCITSEGFELTRCSLVDEAGAVLLDTLVLPRNPITDYNTRYSGITAAMLQNCTARLEDVQEMLLQHITAETLLVGHALENDLAALKLLHSNIIDTALLFPHPRGPPYKSALKVLAERFLRRSIQQGEHDSIIDAQAAMELAILKISKGPSFGTNEGQATDKLVDVVSGHGHRSCLVDRQDTLRRFASSSAAAVPCFSDAHCVAEMRKQVAPKKHSLVWGQLMELQHFYYERSQQKRRQHQQGVQKRERDQQQEQQQEQQQQQQGEEEEDKYTYEHFVRVVKQMDEHVGQVFDALPANSLLIVATGQGDTPECRRQQELKYRRQNGLDGLPLWSQSAEEEFSELCDEVMRGLCWAAVKQ